uniref:Uncharacterized protein n=1 Tax=Vespula pensylvanica TaxID=30213 RepID=A0A834P1Z8_VESPE|nr:hypothetical protein H0235_007874 [Vespula pensylvanica]
MRVATYVCVCVVSVRKKDRLLEGREQPMLSLVPESRLSCPEEMPARERPSTTPLSHGACAVSHRGSVC